MTDHTGSLAAELDTRPTTVLLIDDQPFVGEAVRRMLSATANDVVFHYCADPKAALQRAKEVAPTVILQDLVMPDVDGLTLLKAFRADEATRDVPMIVLSTKEEPKVKAEAFSLGANDYLVKLPDPIELVARIRHHSAGYIAQLQRNAAYQALRRSEQRLAGELAQAAKYVMSMLPKPLSGSVTTDWQFIPSVQLGGDSFGYHWIDDDHFAIYLLDVCGHGVRSALLSISAMNSVRSQALPATDFRYPEQVMAALNDVFDMNKHDGMYFTMWYGVYVRPTRELRFSTGGHPPAVLVHDGPHGVEATPLTLNGMIVGAFPGHAFDSRTVTLEPSDRLYIYSDGVYEITKPNGEMWTFDEFVETLMAEHGGSAVPHVLETVKNIRGSDEFEDDVSLVELQFAD